jgi:hypothetical protein
LIETINPNLIRREPLSKLQSIEKKIDQEYAVTKDHIIQFLYASAKTMDSKMLQQVYRKANTKQIELSALHKVVPKVKPDMKFLSAETQSIQTALDTAHLHAGSVRSISRFNFNTVIKDIAKDHMAYLKREIVQRVQTEKSRKNRFAYLKKSITTVEKVTGDHNRDGSSEILVPEYSAYGPDEIITHKVLLDSESSKKSSFPSSHNIQPGVNVGEFDAKPSNGGSKEDTGHRKNKSIGFALASAEQEAGLAVHEMLDETTPLEFAPAAQVLQNLKRMYVEATEPTTATKDYALQDLICRVSFLF